MDTNSIIENSRKSMQFPNYITAVSTEFTNPYCMVPSGKKFLSEMGFLNQNSSEIKKLANDIIEIISNPIDRNIAIEIGLFRGGTHLIWKSLFNQVISIDRDLSSIMFFAPLVQPGSRFIWGDSKKLETINALDCMLAYIRNVSFLFIDGDHSYNGVLTDWKNYSPFVRKGGIICFHDLMKSRDSNVNTFISELEKGQHGKSYKINKICYEKDDYGIGYYIQE